MATIEVDKVSGTEFRVRVIETAGQSSHRVTLSDRDYQRLAGGKCPPEDLIRRSFEFLLEREPRESILSRFDLPLIGRYFPDYEREIERRIGA